MAGLGSSIGQMLPFLAKAAPSLFGASVNPLSFSDPLSLATGAISSGGDAGSSLSSGDALQNALMQSMLTQNKFAPISAVFGGLSPIGSALMNANILPKQFLPQAAASHGGATAPAPFQIPTEAPFMEPEQAAQLIAQLL